MTVLWLFALLWLSGWSAAQAIVPIATAWLLRSSDKGQLQPRHILLVCALPWLMPFAATLAMVSLAAAKRWGWVHDHCVFHAPHHPHFCFEHLPEMLLGHGHAVVAIATFMVLGALSVQHWRKLHRQSMQLAALTAFSRGRSMLLVLDDERVMAFAAGSKRPHIYVSQGLIGQLSHRERRMVLAHEAAHIRHRDLLFSRWLEHLLLLHFKPSANVLRRLWRDAIETRADERVATRFGRLETAELLLRLTKLTQPVPTPVAFGGGDIAARIHHLLYRAPTSRRERPFFETVVTAGLLALMAGLFISHHTLETLLGALI